MIKKADLQIRHAEGRNERLVSGLVALHLEAYQPHMRYADPHEYFSQALAAPSHVNIVAETEEGLPIGYLLGIPQSEVAEELRRWDPQITADPQALYLDTIQILPSWQGRQVSRKLIARLCEEAQRRGVLKLSMHARTTTGWNKQQGHIFASVRTLRRIENWFGSGEPFDYLEATPLLREVDTQRSSR